MEWTGWGFVDNPDVAGTNIFNDADEMYEYFGAHWTDDYGGTDVAWRWWFDGIDYDIIPSIIEVAGGAFWDPPYPFDDYWELEATESNALEAVDTFMHNGWAVQLSIKDGGHAITCWGYTYDTADPDYYTGVYVTDSDDNHGDTLEPGEQPPDRLRYYEVSYDSTTEKWYLPNYGDWYIRAVRTLMPFPGGDCQDSCRKSSSKDFGLLSHTSLLSNQGLVCLRQRRGVLALASA